VHVVNGTVSESNRRRPAVAPQSSDEYDME
jgi:hypothetical protein